MTYALPLPYADPVLLPVLPTDDAHDMAIQMDSRLNSATGWLNKYDAYLEGEQPIQFMQPALEKELGGRIQPLVINWPRLGTRNYGNRITVEGFRYSDMESGDKNLQEIWQANGLDGQSQQGNTDALGLGRSYLVAGAGDSRDDAPIVTVESPFQMITIRDPRTRQITAGWKRWAEADGTRWGCLYQPNVTRVLTLVKGRWLTTSTDIHNMGRPPVAMLVTHPRILRPDGRSIFHDILPLADAANKMATDMMVSGEFHAMPRRWAFGLSAEDFVDTRTGKPKSAWSAIAGRLWANKDKDIKVGQFDEADLAVFHNTIKVLGQISSQLLMLPNDYIGFDGVNPPSADSMRASETRLVKEIENMHINLGEGYEDNMRNVLRIQTGRWDPKARSLETVFRDPSTPTIAQKADAIVKLHSEKIVPTEQAREDLGYGPIARARMAEMDRRASERGLSVFRDALNPGIPTELDPAAA